MVFESLVADLLNRFLGDFVENLDSSQLNVGIWGGDVKLDNLEVKETALDDLDLPVKLKFGYLSSLVLKIPWKNLYNEPVIATIDGLHLIVVPNKGVVYNEEKAKKNAAEIKQKTLLRLEENRKNKRKPPDASQDTFAEKMVTQIIKNLQVTISNIHVRFEDKYTNRHRPFVAACSLQKLDFQTTDDNWVPTIHRDVVKIINKLVSLENLAVYWNSDSSLFSDLTDKAEIKKKMIESITTSKNRPAGYKYILDPIKMDAKLSLNQKPENDGSGWKIPKIDLSVDMRTLALQINKFQYQDILLFLEAQERFQLAGQYLKYRPGDVYEYRGHYRTWWHFAYECILEEKVRRRRNNWSWERMKKHRQLVRDYKEAWVKNQTEKSPGAAITSLIKKAEEKLDVFNLNVARQQAEMEIDRRGLKRLEDQPQGIMGWAKSWWGAPAAAGGDKKANGKDIVSQFNEAMTPEEKAKLFDAIDYQENIPPTNYPKEFVENKIEFKLGSVAIVVEGAVSMELNQLKANIEQRPSAGAINVKSCIRELRMDGCGAEMLRVRDPSQPWLQLEFDTNPLHKKWDQLVKLNIAPITLKYHAPAVNNAAEVFKPPESVKLNQLTTAAMSRYEEVKTRSVTGLAHAVEKKTKLVLDIQIHPATLMISEGGVYTPEKPTLLADLGLLSITTVDPSSQDDLSKMDKMASLREQAYDRFRVKLSNVVIALAENMDKASAALSVPESPLHVLKPTGLDIQLHKCSIDDLTLPKLRVLGDLPDIVVAISDERLLMLLKLLASIPKPEPDTEPVVIEELPPVQSEVKAKDRAKMKTIMEAEEVETIETVAEKKEEPKKTNEQQVQIELDLKLDTVGVVVFRGDDILTDIRLQRFVCQLQMRTFDMVVRAELGAVSFGMPMFKALDDRNSHLYLINNDSDEGALMQLKFVQANPESPFFATEYKKTEQSVLFKFTRLNVSLHQEGLMELKTFGEDIQKKMAELNKEQADAVEKTVEDAGRKLSRSMSSLAAIAQQRQQEVARRKKAKKDEEEDPSVVKMRVEASIGELAVLIGSEKTLDTVLAIEKVNSEVLMTSKAMDVKATLHAITMKDMTEAALYRDLLSVQGNDVMLRFEMTQYQRTDEEKKAMVPSDIDMKVKVRLAQMRFVFLNLWLCRLMAWLAPFQAEAARAAAHAQAVAAEKSAEAMEAAKQMLEQSPPRIELDVELLAPLLLLPRLSSSTDVLIFDLGNLTVRNKITGDRSNSKAVIDRMDIKMQEVHFAIGRMDNDVKKVASKCQILKPISFSLAVHRNLTFSVVKDIPEIMVDAHLPSIECTMSEADYATLMQTLSGNLAEGKELAPPPPAAVPVAAIEEKKEDRLAGGADAKELTRTVSTSEAPAQKTAKPRIVFQFALDHIGAVLYTGNSTLGERDSAHAFTSMRLETLKLSGSIAEDNSMKVAMSLNTFTMNDERKDKTKIHKLMDKKKGHESQRFLDLGFTQSAKQDKNVKIKMSAFFLCLCPEFLGCLSSFFSVPKTEEELDKEALPSSVKAPAHAQTVERKADRIADANEPPPEPPGAITMDCDMQGIEVVLVEDSMSPEDTQALILSFNIRLVAEPRAHEQVMHGGIEKLRMFSSYYALEKREDVTYEVLKSVDIGLALRINNDTKATEVIVKMSEMELKMAPSVIRLLSAVNAEFAKASQKQEDVTQASGPRRRTYKEYWANKKLEESRFWFLQVPVAEEALEEDDDDESDEEEREARRRAALRSPVEKCTVDIPRLSFTLEAGNEAVPLPLIFLDMRMSADARNWSSALKASADVSLQMSYYNESCSVWEPVIEPAEVSDGVFERWNLKMNVDGRNKQDPEDHRPGMDIKIDADKMLNVTVTKSFLSLLTKLGEVFAAAAKQTSPPTCRQLPGLSPYLILNETGVAIKICNSDTLKVSDNDEGIDATHGAFVDLEALASEADDRDRREDAERILSVTQRETRADLKLELLDTVREITIGRADKRAICLPKESEGGKKWTVICDTVIENSRRLVTLRSHVQVHNHLDVDMEIYSKRDNNLDLAGVVAVGQTINLPVPLLYTLSGELLFKPANDLCEESFESVSWHDFSHHRRATVRCNLLEDSAKGFYFDTLVTQEDVSAGAEKMIPTFVLHLYPPLRFHNNLPFPVKVLQPSEVDLQPGEGSVLNVIAKQKLVAETVYMGQKYTLDMRLEEEPEDLQVVALNTETGSAELLLGLHWSREHGGIQAYIYAPFWLVNNTSLPLRHLESSRGFLASSAGCMPCRHKGVTAAEESEYAIRHNDEHNPIILPFPSTDVGQKKKSRVQVEEKSGWSDEFPLDTVGSAGRIVCKGNDADYELTVSIQLCQSGLTKIVTFTPFYLVSNCGKFDMEVREDGQDMWTKIPAEQCVGVWPVTRAKRKLICARMCGSDEESLLFPITENIETLAQINDDSVGVDVAVTVGESSSTVHLTPFQPGSAPLHIINHLPWKVTFCQKGHPEETLAPNEHVFFTWSDITKDKLFVFKVGDYTGESALDQNKFGEMQPDKSKRHFVYYANFLNGRQRTLLLDEDLTVSRRAFGANEFDVADLHCELKLQGFGLSLVDNHKGVEVLYIGISSSDILWEEEVKKGRFKPLAVKYMETLEEQHQALQVDGTCDEWKPLDKYEFNVKRMLLKKKNGKEFKMRRTFEKGIWAVCGASAMRKKVHFKLNHLQIDNQLDACVFPCVLSVVPPPKSIVQDNAPKPFLELSFVQRISEFTTVPEVEYLRILVQEFAVRIDQGLINSLLALVASDASKKPYGKEEFDADMALTKVKLSDTADTWKSQKPKSYYDDLHISPLMIHLSFSQGGTTGEEGGAMPIQSEFINVLLKSVGVTLTELQDVVFKLAYFERKCVFYNTEQLNGEIISHYTKQAIKQLYVLVLGLDIIGNPFGLVRDLSAGVEDLFYQPFQGAIQGPEEFATGVALGVQSMFGHAVGGVSGAVGRITGTLGKGVAALTFDQEYQRKRQEDLNRKPHTFAEGMARGFKGLGMGVVDGVTGVVRKPIEGAKQEGVGGFFKGAGKGIVGLATRPISGVVDLASSSMNAVKSVAGTHKDTGPIRPPRLIRADKIVRPYSSSQALGNKIFKDTDRGELTATDEYLSYAPISEKVVLLVTDLRLVIAKRTDVMGTWTADWQAEYTKIHPPELVSEGVKIRLLEKKRGFLGIGGSEGKIITFENPQVRAHYEAIQGKILDAYRTATGK